MEEEKEKNMEYLRNLNNLIATLEQFRLSLYEEESKGRYTKEQRIMLRQGVKRNLAGLRRLLKEHFKKQLTHPLYPWYGLKTISIE